MQALASFIMRGRSQAALVAASFAVLSLIVPLVGLVSSAAVALVTLRQGPAEGLLVGAFAGLASGLLAFLALGSPLPAIGFAIALWLPVWVLGAVLRYTRSLAITVQVAAGTGLLILLAVRLLVADPALFWAELLEPVREGLVEGKVIDPAGSEAVVAEVARWMTGALAATFYFQMILALMLGRWWQALLYNPGGFGAEFRALRVHPALGYAGVVVLVVLLLRGESLLAGELLLLLSPLYLLQGIAVVHALAAAFAIARGWLVGFYVLLVIALPHAQILVAGIGLMDIWAKLRERVSPRDKENP